MILELEIVNFPQERASQEFKSYIDAKFGVSNSQIVHIQTDSNKKILIYRLRDEVTFKRMLESKAEFLDKIFEFKAFTRPSIAKINAMLSQRRAERELGIPYSDQSDTSKVYLSNIPNCLNDKILRKHMAQFGPIVETDIIDRSGREQTASKSNKFKFAVVKFKDFESAVNAFFHDKVKFGKKKAKVKLYMEEKASRFYRREAMKAKQGGNGKRMPKVRQKSGQNNGKNTGGTTPKAPNNLGNGQERNLLNCLELTNVRQGNQWGHFFMINHQLVSEGKYTARRFQIKKNFHQQYSSDELPRIKIMNTLEIPEVGVNHYLRNMRFNVEKFESVANRQHEYKFFGESQQPHLRPQQLRF